MKQVTHEIQETRERGLKFEIVTTVFKAATKTLNEDLTAKMEKGKNIEINPNGEDLRMKMLKQKALVMGEREIEVDLSTTNAQEKTAALDE